MTARSLFPQSCRQLVWPPPFLRRHATSTVRHAPDAFHPPAPADAAAQSPSISWRQPLAVPPGPTTLSASPFRYLGAASSAGSWLTPPAPVRGHPQRNVPENAPGSSYAFGPRAAAAAPALGLFRSFVRFAWSARCASPPSLGRGAAGLSPRSGSAQVRAARRAAMTTWTWG